LVQEVQHERSIKWSSQKGENIRKSLKQNIGIGKSYSGKHDISCNLENEGKSVVLLKLLEHVRESTRAKNYEGREISGKQPTKSYEGREISEKQSTKSYEGREISEKQPTKSYEGREISEKQSTKSYEGREISEKQPTNSNDETMQDKDNIKTLQQNDEILSRMFLWKSNNKKPTWSEISHTSPEIKLYWSRLDSFIINDEILYRK
jgi:hypothetical protein